MKLLKKLFLVLIVLACAFTFVGCNQDNDSEEKPEDVIIEVSEKLFESVNVLKVTENLNFPQEVKGVKLTYTSNNEAVISNTGVVTRQNSDVFVTVKVELEYQGVKDSFEIKFKVLKAEKQSEEPGEEPGDEPELPADAVKVEAVLNGNVGDTYKVQGTVAAVNAQSFILSDETGMILVYKGKTWTCDVAKGDVVVVTGASASYAKAIQFGATCEYEKVGKAEFKDGEVKVLDGAGITEIAGKETATIELVQFKGVLSISSGKYYNVAIEGTEVVGSVTYPADTEFVTAFEGKEIIVTGYYTGISGSSTSYFNVMFTEIKATDGTGVDQPVQPEVPSDKPQAPADALTASFVSKDLGLDNSVEFTSIVVGKVEFSATNDGGNNPCKYYTGGEALRFYAKNSFVISAEDGAKIAYIEIVSEEGTNGFNDEKCGYTNATQYYDGKNVVLVPVDQTKDVVISHLLTKGQFRVVSITVYYTE